MLLGDMPIDGVGGKVPSCNISGTCLASSVTYVSACRDLWESVPGALQRLRRIRNTAEVGAVEHSLLSTELRQVGHVTLIRHTPIHHRSYVELYKYRRYVRIESHV